MAQHQGAAISRERTAWELGRLVGECAAQRRPGMLLIELGPKQRGQLVAGARALGQGQVGDQGFAPLQGHDHAAALHTW